MIGSIALAGALGISLSATLTPEAVTAGEITSGAKAVEQVVEGSYGKSSGESNNLEEILNIMKAGEKTPNGKNIISQLDEKTKAIFRMDIGENAHSIRSKGYLEPINHINIEIQRLGQNGKYSPKWDYHIILDDMGNIIDTFTLGVWTK